MAKVGGQWRGLTSAVFFSACLAGLGMFAVGWHAHGAQGLGREMLSSIRGFFGLDAHATAGMADAPERPELYYTTGRSPLPGLDGMGFGPKSDEARALELHRSRGALIGRPTLVDGDTLHLAGKVVTFWGVDAPELGQPCIKNGQGWKCGQEAARSLADYIAGRPVACYDKGTDTEGRMLGQCFVANQDLAAWMARNGWVFARRSVTWAYISDESFAKGDHIGIWRATGLEVPWEWRRTH